MKLTIKPMWDKRMSPAQAATGDYKIAHKKMGERRKIWAAWKKKHPKIK